MATTTHDDLIVSLKNYVERDLWPRVRGIDEPLLLMLHEPNGTWNQHNIFLQSGDEGFRRNQIHTIAMRQAVARTRPYAVSVVAEVRIGTTDPDAHYDHVAAILECRESSSDTVPELMWKLGLDDASISFIDVCQSKRNTFGDLFGGADECVEFWVYVRRANGSLKLFTSGGSPRSSPMSLDEIKHLAYRSLCQMCGVKLNKTAVMKSLVVTYSPLPEVQDVVAHR
jgi:hypothetical protein